MMSVSAVFLLSLLLLHAVPTWSAPSPRSRSSKRARVSVAPELWRFRAFIEDASTPVMGEFALHESGELEVVPAECSNVDGSGDDEQPGASAAGNTRLFGRGTGSWHRRESGVVEAEVQLYTYSVASQPDEPRDLLMICRSVSGGARLRGCVFEASGPRVQIGVFEASRCPPSQTCLSRAVVAVAPADHEQLPRLRADGPLLSAALRARSGRAAPLALERYRVGTLERVYYIPDFLTPEEEAEIDSQLASSPRSMWRQMSGRRVQECGTRLAPSGAGLLIESLPPWMQMVSERLVSLGIFPRCLPPNSVALNQYGRHEGIAAHSDGPIYVPRVAILSLFSPAVMRFYGRQPELPSQTAWSDRTDTPAHIPRGAPTESVLLRPRSLLLFCGQAYREHCHEVAALPDAVEVLGAPTAGTLINGELANASEGDAIQRGERRVSLTIRHVFEFLLAPEAFAEAGAATSST